MAKIVARQVVPGSQELVWHILSDFERTHEWLPAVVSIKHTGGSAKAMGREHTAQMDGGVEAHHRVVAWDDARRLAWRTEREMRDGRDVSKFNNVRTTVDLRPSGSNTEVTVTRTWSGGGLLGLIRSFGQKADVKQEFEQLLTNLNDVMKNNTGSAS
jgi:carbon monoxide dehydrogenase subunit G